MDEKERTYLKIKLFLVGIAVFLVFSILVTRMWNLQVAQASQYAAKAKGNVLRFFSIPAPRGDILDSKGKLLVTSVPKFAITLDWLDLQNAQGTDLKTVVNTLAKYVQPYWGDGKSDINNIVEDILAKIQMHQFRRYEPVVVMEDIPPGLRAVLAEHQQELPGLSVEARPSRHYNDGYLYGHILGYVREVSEGEITSFQNNADKAGLDISYQQGDLVGKMGVENSYDMYLRGQDGVQQMEVDNKARPVERLTRQDPVIGNSIKLTIDSDLQKAVDDSMNRVIAGLHKKGYSRAGAGAAVVIEVKTGRVLAMVSKPNMNPQDLVGVVSDDTFKRYLGTKEEGSPRLGWSRAFQEIYAPGSTFKMITGMTALQDKKVTPTERIYDSKSSLWYPANGVSCWLPGGHGYVNLFSGLAGSCNVYFETVAQRVMKDNPERLGQVAKEFGLGPRSGIDIPGESEGVAPSPSWKKSFGPRIEKAKDAGLQKVEEEKEAKLEAATTAAERNKIEQWANSEKAKIMSDYDYKKYNFVDWRWTDTYNMAMGQGDNKYTMLQLANYVATIANGGHRMVPYLVDQVVNSTTGEVVLQNKPTVANEVSVSPENIDLIKQAMRAVVLPPGTASGVFRDIPQFTGGAKTGTAQVGSKGTAAANDFNGVFVAFAPYDNPQIAFAGVVEFGQHGGTSAGVVAHDAFLQYFKSQGWKAK